MLRSMQPDLEPYVRAWRERFRLASEERSRLEKQARDKLGSLVRRLVEGYGARRVWLFGSLADGAFRRGSDIDLAVEGLPDGAALFRAGADLDDLGRPFRVDLVPMEDAFEPVRRKILETGELLHDAG
jgi:predicted nucleotidyltransferase